MSEENNQFENNVDLLYKQKVHEQLHKLYDGNLKLVARIELLTKENAILTNDLKNLASQYSLLQVDLKHAQREANGKVSKKSKASK